MTQLLLDFSETLTDADGDNVSKKKESRKKNSSFL